MKILIFWDVYWRIGRAALKKELPNLISLHNPDFIIANVENATSWRGVIEKHAIEFEKMWIDIMTSWDHVFDNFEKIKQYLAKENSKLIRAANFYNDDILEWSWYKVTEKNWKKLLVIHLLWETFMNHKVKNPFVVAKDIIEKFKEEKLDWIIVDFHKETTSEWYWMAHLLDWKASFVFWTHTHIQTNDELILKWWTGIISDVWMNWPLYSVIWADFNSVKNRFLSWVNKWKIEQCLDKNYVVNGVIIEVENKLCKKVDKIRIRWVL